MQLGMTGPLIASKGYTVPEVEESARQARETCRRMGDGPELFGVLGTLYFVYYNRGELRDVDGNRKANVKYRRKS